MHVGTLTHSSRPASGRPGERSETHPSLSRGGEEDGMGFTDTPSSPFSPQLEGSARCAECCVFFHASEVKAERKEQNVQAGSGDHTGLNQTPSSKLTVHGPLAAADHSAQESSLNGGRADPVSNA